MAHSNYTARQKRAINQVWDACGDYSFEPQFLAMAPDGQPDLYMNCVIGLVHKWLGDRMPAELFAAWAGDARQALYDDLAWLALENVVYEKELSQRPALEGLRAAHAAAFFESEYQLSRQEWMEKNQLVYAIQSARWKTVLGQRLPVLAPWEKGLYRALTCPGTMRGEALGAAIREAFRKYLRFDGTARKKAPLSIHFGERWVPLLTKLFTTEMVRTDDLAIGRSAASGESGPVRPLKALRARLRSNEGQAGDREYVESCFGRSLYSPRQLSLMEQRCCTGNHLGCHLWFTRGDPVPGKPLGADAQRLAHQAAEQAKQNRKSYIQNKDLYQSALLRLTEHIRNCMLTQQQPDTVPARQGHVDSRRVWRMPVLLDDKVFLRSEEESTPGFTVDLLLDGSASRLHCQETIAAQGYILAKALANCNIPVRVSSFCSLRGYTVLRVLKDYSEKNGEQKIFHYFAAGWNRDGLALRMAGELLRSAPGDRHLLVLLTDASPDDSHKVPPTGKIPLSRDYDGDLGIQDTAEEVRALRRLGIRVAAVFMGQTANLPNAQKIYDRDLAPIRKMDQLSAAAGKLIQQEIMELSG